MLKCNRIESGSFEVDLCFHEYWNIVRQIARDMRTANVDVHENKSLGSCYFLVDNDRIQLEAGPFTVTSEARLKKLYLSVIPDQTLRKPNQRTLNIIFSIKAKLLSNLRNRGI